jgi:hypothetical protein
LRAAQCATGDLATEPAEQDSAALQLLNDERIQILEEKVVVKTSVLLSTLLAALAPLTLPACSVPDRDASAREWEHSACLRIIDEKDRERCLKRVDSEYGRAR